MEISNTDDTIDSREINERVEYLKDQLETKQDEITELEQALSELERDDQEDRDKLGYEIDELKEEREDITTELNPLVALSEEGESYCPDWNYGATLIHEDYFKVYAYEMACDIGAIDRAADWPVMFIDWEAAANALKQDYTEVDFDGETYLVR